VGEEWEGWRGRVGELMLLSDTGNQVVCTVGQTDGHSNPDHTTRRADVKWNSLTPQATLKMVCNTCCTIFHSKTLTTTLLVSSTQVIPDK